MLGAWLGLLGGLGEAAMLAVSKYGFHRAVQAGVDVVWAAPLSLAVLGLLLAVPTGLLARSRFGARWPALPLGILCFLAVADFTPALIQIHWAVRLLLIAGIATQAARMLARRPDRVMRLAGRTLIPLTLLMALLAVTIPLVRRLRERAVLAALPAPAGGIPNVLLIVLDTQRALDLSLYGYARRTTPTLERLGREGIVFDQAYASSSWTLSSIASMFTGRPPLELGAGWLVPLDTRYPTLAETLASRGYLTGGFSANPFYVSRASGLARGFGHFEDHRLTPLSVLLKSAVAARLASRDFRGRWFNSWQYPSRKSARHLKEDVLEWLAKVPDGRPFFAFLTYYDAHAPYLPPPPFDTAFTGRRIPWTLRNPTLSAREPVTPAGAAAERDAYNQAIASQDDELGDLLDRLEQAGKLRNTIVAITADHGEEFGEHGLLGHGFSLNPALLWVPLILREPSGRLRGVRISETVSLINLSATLLALADSTRPSELPGISLLHRGGDASRSPAPVIAELPRGIGQPGWFPVSSGPLRSLTRGTWHYVVNATGKETLMDLSTDRAGRVISPDAPGYRSQVEMFRAILDSAGPAQSGGAIP